MNNIELQKEFDKVERLIAIKREQGEVPTALLQQKIMLLKTCYDNLSEARENGELQNIAPIYAKELAFLNNIKNIQIEINQTTQDTDEEIAKVHTSMRENGLGWILDNLPERKE